LKKRTKKLLQMLPVIAFERGARLCASSLPFVTRRSRPLRHGNTDGVIAAEGGRFGNPICENNTLATVLAKIVSTARLPSGHTTTVELTPDAGSRPIAALLRKTPGSGQARLLVNGTPVGETHFTTFGGFASSAGEPLDIGRDSGSPVSAAYQAPTPYAGRATRVTTDLP
jgi:arylsulfatase